MPTPYAPPTDPRLIAAAALWHPASLVLPSTAATALALIARAETGTGGRA